jgi:flagellar biogenesis protein FliO
MTAQIGGAAAWILARLRGAKRRRSRLELLDRLALGPRQSVALIEAEGRRFLLAMPAEGGPVFFPLDGKVDECGERTAAERRGELKTVRASW